MAFRMDVTQRGNGQKASVQVSGERRINAKDASAVQLYLERPDLLGTLREGDDLLIRLADGSVVRIDGYFACGEEAKPEIVFAETAATGDEWLLKVDEETCGPVASTHSVAWEAVPANQSLMTAQPVTGAQPASAASAAVSAEEGGGVGLIPIAGVGAAVIGGIAVAAGSDGSSGGGSSGSDGDDGDPDDGGDPDTTAPGTPVLDPTNGKVITGSAEPGSEIGIDLDGDGDADATVDAGEDGTFTYTPETPLEDGDTITVTATDDAGNTSDPATQTVDGATPVPTIDRVTDDVGTVTGELENGDETDDARPMLIGSGAEPGATVSIYDGDVLIGSTEADADGEWSFTPESVLAEGQHSLTVAATDALGNESDRSDAFVIIVDKTAPPTPTVEAGDGSSITITAEPGAMIDLDLDGDGTPDASANVGDDGIWIFTPETPLAEGIEIVATATDEAGNTSDPATDTVDGSPQPGVPRIDSVVDDIAPMTGSLQRGELSNDPMPVIAGSNAAGNATVSVFDNDVLIGTAMADANGDWTFMVVDPLADGPHSFTVSSQGGTQSAAFTVVIDATAPSPPQINMTDGSLITGTAEAGATVALDLDDDGDFDVTVIADENGEWSIAPEEQLEDGTRVIATAADEAGNTSDPAFVIVDAAAPPAPPQITLLTDDVGALTGNVSRGGVTDDTRPTLSGTAPANATIAIFDGTAQIGETTANARGEWSFTPTAAIGEGTHSFRATATTASGTSAQSASFSITIDTTAPAAPTIDPTDGSFVTGDAEPGATVRIDVGDDGTIDATVVAEADGTWQYDPPTPIPDGTTITATASDPAGNPSPEASVEVDGEVEVPPAAPVIDSVTDDVAPQTGEIGEGGASNDPRPTISGSGAPANATVTVFDGAMELGSTTADADGEWTFTPSSDLDEGNHSLTAVAANGSGTSDPSAPYAIIVDTLAPAAPTIDPTDGSLVTGDAEPGATVRIDVGDDGNIDATVVAEADGTWQYAPPTPIPDGTTITATASDPAGNPSPEASVEVDGEVEVPPAAPVIDSVTDDVAPQTGEIGEGGASNDPRPTISGSGAPANATVTVFDGAMELGSTTADADGEWTFTPSSDLDEGNHSLTAVAANGSGTSDPSAPYAIIVDTLAPAAPTIDPTDGSLVTGDAEPGATVRIDVGDDGTIDATVVAEADGTWQYDPPTPIPDGTTITATASDPAGNPSPEASVEVDGEVEVPPAAPVIDSVTDDVAPQTGEIGEGGASNDPRPTISGSGAPANATVTVFDGAMELGSTTADADGEWTFTPSSDLDEGNHSLTAVAANGSGTSDPSAPYVIIVDTLAPALPTIDPTDGSEITGSAEAGTTVMIDLQDDGTTDGTALVDENGIWSYTPTAPLEDGDTISVTAVDDAGNVSPEVGQTVDSGGPDPQPPTAMIEITAITEDTGTPGDFVTEDTTPRIEGTLSESLGAGEDVEVRIDSGAWLDATVSGTTWFYDFGQIAEGDHTIEARVVGAGQLVGDLDTQAITIEVPVVENRAPLVQVNEADLLGIISAETLALIDFNGQALFAIDPDNNLSEVTVSFEPLLSVDLAAFTLRADQGLAASLGLTVSIDNDPGLLGILAPSSILTITATDGGTMDNVAVNQLLGTVRYEQDITLVGAQVLNATRISATDADGLSDSDAVGNLADLSLLNGNPPAGMAATIEITASGIFDDQHDTVSTLYDHSIVSLEGAASVNSHGPDWAASGIIAFA